MRGLFFQVSLISLRFTSDTLVRSRFLLLRAVDKKSTTSCLHFGKYLSALAAATNTVHKTAWRAACSSRAMVIPGSSEVFRVQPV
ncbi:hypothetical protein B0H16DRAFT_1628465, partial [Mycena metata]